MVFSANKVVTVCAIHKYTTTTTTTAKKKHTTMEELLLESSRNVNVAGVENIQYFITLCFSVEV